MTRFFVQTLGCPKNAVDSDKIEASLVADGLERSTEVTDADLVVVNTCAFIEAAREESIGAVLSLAEAKRPDARLVVTGCMAERYGSELAEALPEVDAVIGFSGESSLAEVVLRGRKPTGVRDLADLGRPAPTAPWAYVKIAEGCDRACAFCAIPSFRGAQRSRTPESLEAEVRGLVAGGAVEIVLVAQDLASYGRDVGEPGALEPLLRRLDRLSVDGLARIRLLYLYPSEVRDPLVSTILELDTVVSYFDLSLQHVSRPLLRRMKRWGSGERFVTMIEAIRADRPDATFRSNFIVGFPGETENHHDELLEFLSGVQLDWAGFFAFSREDGTAAADLDGEVGESLVAERLAECTEIQDAITRDARDELVGCPVEVLVDSVEAATGVAIGRTYREAPEIDGVVRLYGAEHVRPGAILRAEVTAAFGPDLDAKVATT